MYHRRACHFARTAAVLLGAGVLFTVAVARGADAELNRPEQKVSASKVVTSEATASPMRDSEQKALRPTEGTEKRAASEVQISEQSFGEWTLECHSDTSVRPRCQIVHRLTSPDRKQVLLVLSLASLSESTTGLQLALPLGFSIQSGVRITFGNDYSTDASVSRCTQQGCIVEGVCPPEMVAAMKRERSGSVSVRSMQSSDISLAVSLDGFAAAFSAMSARDGGSDEARAAAAP